MPGDLDGAKAALADAIPEGGDENEALSVIFAMVGEVSWQLCNLLDDIMEGDERDPMEPEREGHRVHRLRLELALSVNEKLSDILDDIIAAEGEGVGE